MKFKNRLLALILALILTATTGFSSLAENVSASEISEAVSVPLSSEEFEALYTMGMIGEDFASLTENAPVSRAQFIGSLFKVAGYGTGEYAATDIPFIDVNEKTAYKNEICYFYSMGLINGTSANTFSPNESITYGQAAKVILDVCGYREYTAVRFGTTLDAYISMAILINLSKGITGLSANKWLEAEQAVKLLYNAGRTKVMQATAYNNKGDAFYETYNGEELFSLNNNLYYEEGVLQSNGLVSLLTTDVDKKFAIINGVQYLLGGLNLSEIIGCNVKFFYKNENGIKTLAWVGASSKTKKIELTADELRPEKSGYSMENIIYKKDNKMYYARVSSHADIVYNNALYNDADIDKLKPRMGRITLIDNDADNSYDTVIVEEYINIFVKGVVLALNLITDKYGNSVYLDEYEEVRVFRNGIEAEITDIELDTVVSVVADRNKRLIVLHLNESWSQGKLLSAGEENGQQIYEFENGMFELAKSYIDIDPNEYYKIDPTIGKTYKYYPDRNGRIAEIQEISGTLEYAYLITADEADRLSSAGSANVKLLLLNNTIVRALTKKKMKINGVGGKTGTDLLADPRLYDENGEVKEQVVRVAFDDEGNIKEFEFAVDNTGHEYGYDEANFSLDYTGKHYHGSWGSVLRWNKFLMGSWIKVFVKYEGLDVEEPYAVLNGQTIISTEIQMKIYDCDSTLTPAVASAVAPASRGIGEQCLVSKVLHRRVDGEMKKHLGVYFGSSYVEYPELNEGVIPADIKRGDVVSIQLYNSQITSVSHLARLADRPEPFATGTFPDSLRLFGYIYSLSTSSIVMLSPDNFVSGYGKLLPMALAKDKVIPVTIYDVKNDEIVKGSWEDLSPAVSPNSDGSLSVDENTVMALVQVTEYKVHDVILVKY